VIQLLIQTCHPLLPTSSLKLIKNYVKRLNDQFLVAFFLGADYSSESQPTGLS
jgi:hypothetical protein